MHRLSPLSCHRLCVCGCVAASMDPEKSQVLCKYFLHGACRHKSGECPFSHDLRQSSQSLVCKYYLQGCCAYGVKCRYDHVKPHWSAQGRSVPDRPCPQTGAPFFPVTSRLSPPHAWDGTAAAVVDLVAQAPSTMQTTSSRTCSQQAGVAVSGSEQAAGPIAEGSGPATRCVTCQLSGLLVLDDPWADGGLRVASTAACGVREAGPASLELAAPGTTSDHWEWDRAGVRHVDQAHDDAEGWCGAGPGLQQGVQDQEGCCQTASGRHLCSQDPAGCDDWDHRQPGFAGTANDHQGGCGAAALPWASLTLAERPLCSSLAAYGACSAGDQCKFVHGLVCEVCHHHVLHPHNAQEAEQHVAQCRERHDKLQARLRSAEIECGICMEKVLSSPNPADRRFGLLTCDHSFCLRCIRTWRANTNADMDTAVRTCPVCRVTSHFITPSLVWPTCAEEKEQIIAGYKTKLSQIDCQHFDKGKGLCPFGTSCFYRHMYPDGRLESREVSLRTAVNDEGGVRVLQQPRLSDFLDTTRARRVLEGAADRSRRRP